MGCSDLAAGAAGHIYLLDSWGGIVKKMNHDLKPLASWSTDDLGLALPTAICADPSEPLVYIVDSKQGQVAMVNATSGRVILQFDPTLINSFKLPRETRCAAAPGGIVYLNAGNLGVVAFSSYR